MRYTNIRYSPNHKTAWGGIGLRRIVFLRCSLHLAVRFSRFSRFFPAIRRSSGQPGRFSGRKNINLSSSDAQPQRAIHNSLPPSGGPARTLHISAGQTRLRKLRCNYPAGSAIPCLSAPPRWRHTGSSRLDAANLRSLVPTPRHSKRGLRL